MRTFLLTTEEARVGLCREEGCYGRPVQIAMTLRQRVMWALRPEPKTREGALANIRRHYAEMGIPLDDLSDEEIERRIRVIAEAGARAGVTVAEAGKALQRLGRTVASQPRSSISHPPQK
jgi:hypothetical protein